MGEDGIMTTIPKDKAEELLEVIRNGMDKDGEVPYRHHQEQPPAGTTIINTNI